MFAPGSCLGKMASSNATRRSATVAKTMTGVEAVVAVARSHEVVAADSESSGVDDEIFSREERQDQDQDEAGVWEK